MGSMNMTNPYSILLIEDNEGDVLLTQLALEETQIPIALTVVKDGHEAIEWLNNLSSIEPSTRLELILLDINMPKKNGHEVLSYLRQSNSLNKVPVIVLTTSSSPKDRALAQQLGVFEFISKPTDVTEFFGKIAGVISTCYHNRIEQHS